MLEEENIIELASDQTSCHNVYNGGYYPVQISFEEANRLMVEDPARFKSARLFVLLDLSKR